VFNLLDIPSTLTLITKYWEHAEAELRSVIEKKYHDLDEEFVTKLFCCEFAFLLLQASQKKEFEHAFLADLRRAFPKVQSFELSPFSSGLIADVSLHKRHEEKITGGDFGLTITRPQVACHGQSELVRGEYCRGLLVQAKIKRRNGKWGNLRGRQKDHFPERMNYLALLLYSYSDVERRCLEPFSWQLCRDATLENTEDWLKLGKFPSLLSSAETISQLGSARKETDIGTGDQGEIEKFIITKGKPHLEVRIFWPPDKSPPKRVHLGVEHKVVQQLKIRG
jgi:hypothetical protein